MKYVGVSTPAWTILGKRKEKVPEQPPVREAEASPSLSMDKRLPNQMRIPTIPRQRIEKVYPPPKESSKPPPVKSKQKQALQPKAERFPVSKDSAFGPGPASYQQDIITNNITGKMANISFGYRFDSELPKEKKEPIVLPSPEPIPLLHYPQYKQKEVSKSITFTKAHKDSLANLAKSEVPGPGFYTVIDTENHKPTSKAGTFGKPKDPNSKSGSTKDDDYAGYYSNFRDYEVPKSVPKNKAITRSMSEQKIKKPEAPQPSSVFFDEKFYEFKAKGPKWRFGDSNRPPLNATNQTSIGPGEYIGLGSQFKFDPDKHSLPRLPKAKRQPLNEKNNVPGPGTYPLEIAEDDVIGQKIKSKPHGPAFSMRGKFPLVGSADKLRMPGPGQYEVHNLNQIGMDKNKLGPILYCSERNISTIEKECDGPQMYDVTQDLGSGNGVGFTKSKRQPMNNGTDPDIDLGPGYYDLKPTMPQLQPYEQAKLNQLEHFDLNLI
jgi:hypothetical protein